MSDPLCPVCQKPIAFGTRVILEHGELRHADCHLLTERVVTLVRDFLSSHSSHRYCYTCLARYTSRDRQEVEKAVTALRLTPTFTVKPALCSACDFPRVTIQARQAA